MQGLAFKWKMSFNPEVAVFSRNTENITYPNLSIKNLPIVKTAS